MFCSVLFSRRFMPSLWGLRELGSIFQAIPSLSSRKMENRAVANSGLRNG
jgi:hypothetical protein